jgi:hypothetical protein
MGYLACEKCGGYYKLQESEKADDYKFCQCCGRLEYYKHISDYLETENILENLKDHQKDIHHEKEELE